MTFVVHKRLILISLLCTLLAVFWQEYNLNFLNGKLPSENGMLTSADEASYFAPPRNLIEKGIWKDNSEGLSSFIQRPPGYGLIYLCCNLFGADNSYTILKFIQVGFFFGSLILFGRVLFLFGLSNKAVHWFTLAYGMLPFSSGFMYFTLTEAVTPFFLLWSVYEWCKFRLSAQEYSWRFIASNLMMILIRPQLILFPIFMVFFLLYKSRKSFLVGLIVFLPFLLWQLRSISIANGWTGIHPIYANSNVGLYRPSHEKMTNLFRIWEHDGEKYHSVIRVLAEEPGNKGLYEALKIVPEHYRQVVKPVLKDYQTLIHLPVEDYAKGSLKKFELPGEVEFITKIEEVRRELIKQNKLDYYVLTPFKSFKRLVISSHLNLAIFQQKHRGVLWMEALRWTCVLLIFSAVVSGIIFALPFFNETDFKWILFICAGTIFYLVFFQRMNEERYITPLIPIMVLGLIIVCNKLVQKKTTSEEVVFKNQ